MSHPQEIPCPELARGCGGCDLGTLTIDEQRVVRADRVRRRLTPLWAQDVAEVHLDPWGWRTTVRAAVVDGRAGYRRAHSHDVVLVDGCPISHPVIEQILSFGRFPGCTEVVIRIGARTGEVMVVGIPTAAQVDLTGVDSVDPDSVRIVGADELDAGRRSWIHEEAAGRRWRLSARSFFQARPDGAEALVDVVATDVARLAGRPDHLVDLYAGVGLFAGTIEAGRVTAVENSRSSCADARINLAELSVKVVTADVARWNAGRADAVIADPSRRGLGSAGVAVVHRSRAPVVSLVSCDLDAAVRDVTGLVARGFRIDAVTLVEMFPHTTHVELVTTLTR